MSEERLDRIEAKLDQLLESVERIMREGTGRKPGRITKLLEEHTALLDSHDKVLQRIERQLQEDNGAG